ncbi:MAG: hypothetical protein KVP17_001289 [Porospora cf. gigantea B]|uniref:uncharacterized protein n=1 Tax=Porospora cf. gigantea B TaxID=2853592 RepID=UPI003571E38A|nr:MAG: hypothetical protein KVP17_001289 [Porospora cf. gigantea B]
MGFKWSASESAWIAREFKSPTICNDAAWKGQGKEAGLDTLAPFWPRTPMSLDLALSSQGALALKHEDAGRWISFLDSVAEDVGAVEVSPEQSSENAEEPDLPWTGWKTVDLAFAASYRLGMRSLIEDSFLSRVSSLWAFTMLMVFVLERYVISRLIQSGIWDLYPQTPSLPPYGNRMVVKALRYKGFGASTEGSSTGLVKRWPTETSFVKTSSSFAVDGLHSVSHTHQAAVVQPLGSFLPLEGAIRIGSPGHEEYQGMGLLGQPPVSPTANHFGTTRLWHWADSASQERTSETWDRPEVPHQVPVLGGDLLIFGSPMDSKTSQTILRQLEALSARWITA